MAEVGIVQQVDINNELQGAYLDYAMSVIVSRALPDVRDGLKPVHRRILYAMYDMGLYPERPYKKSARIVGEVLGKYHPHGDVAVYDAMVRMAQDFSMRYPLVDGQGNFGSVDGDNAAAMRYTEARLAPPAIDMLGDIGKQTVDFSFNFDGTLKEPTVLPAMLPNLLVNGADGIAVGMSTKIPPHNIGELCDALEFLVARWDRREEVTVEELMRFVQGPDFPTGGLVYRFRDDKGHDRADTILNAYATGRGRIVVQARTHVEEMSRNRSRIVVTELPYQTNKANLIERIAELARDGRIEGITDLRDESDRRGMRVVIELTRNVQPVAVLGHLFKLTPLRQTFGVILLALVDGQPRMLSLKRALSHFVEHRQTVIRRRSEYDLERARTRAHVVEGLRIALDNLDEVIATIRRSQRVDSAKANLIKRFKLSDVQAQAILDMRLARLAALERKRIEEEYRALREEIAYLETLLATPAMILGVIRDELKELKKRYGDARRSLIITDAEYTGSVVQSENLIPDGDVIVTVSVRGEIQRIMNTARRPRSGNGYAQVATANNRHELLIVGASGRVWRTPVHQLPEKTGQARGEALAQLLSGWERTEEVAALLDIPTDEELLAQGFLLAVTRNGRVVRVSAREARNLHAGTALVNVESGDQLLWAGLSRGESELLLVSAQGQGIRFKEEDVRPTGLGVQGVWGMKLEEKGDAIVGAGLAEAGDALLVVSSQGQAKRTLLADYPIQGRYGKGVRAMKLDATTGPLAAAAVVSVEDQLTVQGHKRASVDLLARHVSEANRYQQGAPLPDAAPVQPIIGLIKWGTRSAWPNGHTGIESASETAISEPSELQNSDEDERSAPSSRRKGSASERQSRSKPKVKEGSKSGSQQLTLSLVEPTSGERGKGAGVSSRAKRGKGPQTKK